MRDSECIHFLQWALPRMHMRWEGFRKVRKQVCKRIERRMRELNLEIDGYREFLTHNEAEWSLLDSFCRITISRFYRDRGVFDSIAREALPHLAGRALGRGDRTLYCWSAGCASGEEAYTLKIIWETLLSQEFPALAIHITATDADSRMLRRALRGSYTPSSLRELPPPLLSQFHKGDEYTLPDRFRQDIDFLEQDIRLEMPDGPFHLILCRNLVCTYFEAALQEELLNEILYRLLPGGLLVIGIHESLPPGATALMPVNARCRIYQKTE